MKVVTGSLHLKNFLFFSGILLGLFVLISCQEYFNKLWKSTIFTLLVTMVTMKEGNPRWPKLALIFSKISSDVHQQTMYSIIFFQIILIWFMWQLTWFMWHLTPLLKIVFIQDGGFKVEPFSRTIFNVNNNLYCYSLWSDHLVACLNYVIFLFRPKRDMRKWKSCPRWHGSKLLMQRTSMYTLFCANLCCMCDFVCCGLRSEVWSWLYHLPYFILIFHCVWT